MPADTDYQHTQELIDRTNRVIAEAEHALQASDEAFRDMGLDPDKVRTVIASQALTQAQENEARELFEQDMVDINHAVEQESAHARQRATPRANAASRRPRNMV